MNADVVNFMRVLIMWTRRVQGHQKKNRANLMHKKNNTENRKSMAGTMTTRNDVKIMRTKKKKKSDFLSGAWHNIFIGGVGTNAIAALCLSWCYESGFIRRRVENNWLTMWATLVFSFASVVISNRNKWNTVGNLPIECVRSHRWIVWIRIWIWPWCSCA